MRKSPLFFLAILILGTVSAQNKFDDRLSKTGSDDLYLFSFADGDTLVYEVNANGTIYNFTVALKQYDWSGKGIAFDWQMSAPVSRSGSVLITSEALLNSRSYINRFSGGSLVLKDASTVFLTSENFGDMPEKVSKLALDGEEVTFYRPAKDEVPYTVKIGGHNYVLDGFKINNKEDGTGDKTIVIQGISSHSVILKMDLGFTIELKEIR